MPMALGRSGIRALKREGDGGTPLGRFPIRQVLYRADRGPRPRTELPVRTIREDDGWCDDPSDRNYNRLIKLPSKGSAEGLKRTDHLYDLVLVLGYNDLPRVRGKGSAIFVHLARPGLTANICARDATSANGAGSAPVIHTCAESAASAS